MRKDRYVGGTHTGNTASLAQCERLVRVQALTTLDANRRHLHVVEIFGQANGFHLLLVVDFAGLPVKEPCVNFFGVHEPTVAARQRQVRKRNLEQLFGVDSRAAENVNPAGALGRGRLATGFKNRVRLFGQGRFLGKARRAGCS